MITSVGYGPSHDYITALQYLEKLQPKSVIDIGAAGNLWASLYVTAAVDYSNPEHGIQWFQGNMSFAETWEPVLEYVSTNGKFDFAICTHTLEDILNPQLVCDYLGKIAKEGYIAVPSKFVECGRWTRPFRGWNHHRWIWDYYKGEFIGYPKLSFVEYADWADKLAEMNEKQNQELWLWWRDNIKITADFVAEPLPGGQDMIPGYYARLLEEV